MDGERQRKKEEKKKEGEEIQEEEVEVLSLSLYTFLSFFANMAVTADILKISADMADIFPNQYPFIPCLHF